MADFHGLPIPNRTEFKTTQNKLIIEELNYDIDNNKILHDDLYSGLNNEQKYIYNSIIDSVYYEGGTLFFVYRHGGTGKTFLWSTIIAKLQSKGKIVLTVAASGIATLLLLGGRTTHSHFRLPLDVTKESTCDIKKKTQLAKLILTTSLIIWDEAPMANRYCFEVLDRSLRGILSDKDPSNANRIFGGITIALGGDFGQILLVIPKGKKYDVMQACVSSSPLWEHVTMLKLIENIRLKKNFQSVVELDELTTFDRWLLQIGKGTRVSEDESFIEIPKDLKLSQHRNPEERIVNVVFPNPSAEIGNVDYIRERGQY